MRDDWKLNPSFAVAIVDINNDKCSHDGYKPILQRETKLRHREIKVYIYQ